MAAHAARQVSAEQSRAVNGVTLASLRQGGAVISPLHTLRLCDSALISFFQMCLGLEHALTAPKALGLARLPLFDPDFNIFSVWISQVACLQGMSGPQTFKGLVVQTYPVPIGGVLCIINEPSCFSNVHPVVKMASKHHYWSLVENKRVSGGRVVQRHALYLGEINSSQEAAWRKPLTSWKPGSRRPAPSPCSGGTRAPVRG